MQGNLKSVLGFVELFVLDLHATTGETDDGQATHCNP